MFLSRHGGDLGEKHKDKLDILENGKSKENLDMRLNRLMLGEDLPLFLQEFAVEWQEGRMKKLGKEDPGSYSAKQDHKKEGLMIQKSVKVEGVLKKNVKRLGKQEKRVHSRDLKEFVKKMIKVVKEQIREDILEQMVADKVESWHRKNLSELGEVDNEDEETPSIYK